MQDKDYKKLMKEKIKEFIRQEALSLNDNLVLSPKDKLEQMDILLNTDHFLNDYDENVKILNDHISKNRWERKSKTLEHEIDDL